MPAQKDLGAIMKYHPKQKQKELKQGKCPTIVGTLFERIEKPLRTSLVLKTKRQLNLVENVDWHSSGFLDSSVVKNLDFI